jgi:hypothetical protein
MHVVRAEKHASPLARVSSQWQNKNELYANMIMGEGTMRRFLCGVGVLVGTPLLCAHAQSRIEGTVTDSLRGKALAGATVIALAEPGTRDSAFHSTRTDGSGRFVIGDLVTGRYALSVEHPLIDSTGIGAPSRVIAVSTPITHADLALPSAGTLRRAFCAGMADSLGSVVGVVRSTEGTPIPGATVAFVWSDFDVDRNTLTTKSKQMSASVRTDSLGVYRACGLPTARNLVVQAQVGAAGHSGAIDETIPASGIIIRELRVGEAGLGAVATNQQASLPASGKAVLTGRIETTTGAAVRGAQVRLYGTSRSVTTSDRGDFRFQDLPSGTQGFEVVALGFYPRRFRADLAEGTTDVKYRLERAQVVLDSIKVTAKRVAGYGYAGEFEERLGKRPGYYVTEEEIERRKPFMTSDLLRLMSGTGITMVVNSNGSVTMAQNRGVSTLRGMLPGAENPASGSPSRISGGGSVAGRHCPAVYLDGVELAGADVNSIPPSMIHGIEVYSQGWVPAKYNSLCGVILIWSK